MADRETPRNAKGKKFAPAISWRPLTSEEKKITPPHTSSGLSLQILTQRTSLNFFSEPWSNLQSLRVLCPLAGFFFFFTGAPCAFVPTKSVPLSICSVKTTTSPVNDPRKRRVTSCHPSFRRKSLGPTGPETKKVTSSSTLKQAFQAAKLVGPTGTFFFQASPGLARSGEALPLHNFFFLFAGGALF